MKTTMLSLILTLSLFVPCRFHAQHIRDTVEYFDSNRQVINEDSAAFYREISYDEKGKPIGIVRDYYISKDLMFEGRMLSVNPDTLDGICVWYYQNGQKGQEAIYKVGKNISRLRQWSREGKEEGVLDSSSYFFSKVYRNDALFDYNSILEETITIDSLSVEKLKKYGKWYYRNGQYTNALELFKIGHDLSLRLNKDDQFISVFYHNIGLVLNVMGYRSEALNYYHKAIDIRKTRVAGSALATSYLNIAKLYADLGNHRESLTYFTKSYEIYDEIGNHKKRANALNGLGYLYSSMEDSEKALFHYKEAMKIRKKFNFEQDLAVSYTNIGGEYVFLGKYGKALKFLHKSKNIREKFNFGIDIARAYTNLGILYSEMKAFNKALKYYNKALSAYEELDADIAKANTYQNIGTMYSYMGQKDFSIKAFLKEQSILEALELDENLAQSYYNTAQQFLYLGNYSKALFFFNKARHLWDKEKSIGTLARTIDNIGVVYSKQMNYHAAIVHYKEAERLRIKYKLLPGLVESYNYLAIAYEAIGKQEEANEYIRKCEDMQGSVGIKATKPLVGYFTAHIAYNNNEYDVAIRELRKSLREQKRLNQVESQVFTLDYLGVSYLSESQTKKALKYLTHSKELCIDFGLENFLTTVNHHITAVFMLNMEFDKALQLAAENIQLHKRLRQSFTTHADKLALQRNNFEAISIAVLCAWAMDKDSLAFTMVESLKNRLFVDLLNEKEITVKEVSAEIMDKQQSINENILTINTEIYTAINGNERKKWIEIRDSLVLKKIEIEDEIRMTTPEYANLAYPQIIEHSKVQNVLRDQEVIVSYFMGINISYVFIITPSQLQMLNLGTTNSLNSLVEQYNLLFIQHQEKAIRNDQLMKIKADNFFFDVSSRLYEKLWAPIDSMGILVNKDLIIIPDGMLHYLPFELLVKDKSFKSYKDYQYLIKDYDISYYPSVAVLHFNRVHNNNNNNKSPDLDFFGLGKSDFKDNHCRGIENIPISSLPLNLEEVNTIGSRFPKSHILKNAKADESTLKATNLAAYRYLHFSTHGFINANTPEFSRILLTPSKTEDGCLNMYEIFNLELNADLVSLSACETGLGKLVLGEGMIGFTRALMYAGTPSVILSLWSVVDESTKNLFINYYTQLANNGTDKYQPLRDVQLKMIQEGGDNANPFYWAPFVFIGERYARNY